MEKIPFNNDEVSSAAKKNSKRYIERYQNIARAAFIEGVEWDVAEIMSKAESAIQERITEILFGKPSQEKKKDIEYYGG